VNVRVYVRLAFWIGLLAKLGVPSDWTLCGNAPRQLQVTVVPAGMVSIAGFVLPL
jgi:hypothetical protein